MATGSAYFKVSGLDELIKGLEGTSKGLRDLRSVHRTITRKGELYVRGHEPIYAGSSKDSRTHKPPGWMQMHTKGGVSTRGTGGWVSVSDTPYFTLQEFGGKSYWFRGASGSLRKANRAHRAVQSLAGGFVGTDKVRVRGHVVYTKPRRTRGYFLWNWPYRLRSFIGEQLTHGIADVAHRHGLAMEVDSTSLGLEQRSWGGQLL
jgi:hypothetical protein